MSIVRESIGSRSGEGDRNGRRSQSRVFVIAGIHDPGTILAAPHTVSDVGGQSLPPYGDVWNGMRLERYTVTGAAPRIIAVAEYVSPNISILKPRTLPPEVGQIRFTGAVQLETYDIPIAVRSPIRVVSQAAAAQVVTIRAWKPETIKVFGSVTRFTTRVLYQARSLAERFAAISAMAEQNHRIHLLSFDDAQRPYLFTAGDWRETDAGLEMEYTWTWDPGHPEIRTGAAPDQVAYPSQILLPVTDIIGFYGRAYWTRPPYSQVYLVPADDAEVPPTFDAICPYAYDPYGWQSLRGL